MEKVEHSEQMSKHLDHLLISFCWIFALWRDFGATRPSFGSYDSTKAKKCVPNDIKMEALGHPGGSFGGALGLTRTVLRTFWTPRDRFRGNFGLTLGPPGQLFDEIMHFMKSIENTQKTYGF